MKRLRAWLLVGLAWAVGAPTSMGLEIFSIGDPILAIDLDEITSTSNYPANESPANVLDGDPGTKYLNFAELNTGFIVTPFAPSIVQSFVLTTANDAVARDPASWALYGTNDTIISADNSTGTLENWSLIGEGSLALPETRLTMGSVVPVTNSTSYSSYRMVFPTVKDAAAANSMQIADVAFFPSSDGTGTNVLQIGNDIRAIQLVAGGPMPQSSYPAAEAPAMAIDGNVNTKYLNFGEARSGFIITPSSGPSIVDSFQITTANDAPARDPASYQIFGTNEPIQSTNNSLGNAENWTMIAEGSLFLPEERFAPGEVVSISNSTAYASYRVIFPTVKDEAAANSMQIADIQFFAHDPLTLEVNRDTGEVRILSEENFTFHSYEIRSGTYGSLDPDNWNSIASSNRDPDDPWVETSATSTSLAEEDGPGGANNGITIGAGQSISLGNVWLRTPFDDLAFDVRNADGLRIADGVSFIGSEVVVGDYNGDGFVDASDWPIFRAGLGGVHTGLTRAEAYLKGDLDGDFDTDIFDYNAFIALVPGGAAALAGVPEPSSLLLLGMASMLLAGRRRRRAALKATPVVALAAAVGLASATAEAQDFTNIGQPIAVSTPDPIENDASGPANLFDDTALDGHDIDLDLFVLSYQDPNIFPPGAPGSLQYAGQGESPKTVFMDYGSSISPKWFAYAQRSGADPTADRVGKFEFWFSNTDFGGALPQTAPQAVFEMDADDGRLQDSFLRPYPLDGNVSGRFAAVRFTVSDLSEPRPTNNIGGHEFRFLSGPAPVVLEVNRANGTLTLKNNGTGAQSFDLSGYEIKSELGGLVASSFNGLRGDSAAFPAGNGTGNGWELGGGNNANRLIETNLNTDSTLAAGVASLNLGAAYNINSLAEDLSFRFTNSAGHVFDAVVQYVGAAPPGLLPGDFNDNGIVDAADYTLWRDNLGSTTANLPNDPTPSIVDQNDYKLWKANFGKLLGGAGFGSSTAVPEPTSLGLAGLLLAAVSLVGRRRR